MLPVSQSQVVGEGSPPVQFDGSRRGKNVLKSSRAIKMKARAVVGRGENSLLSDPESELRLGTEKKRR